MFCYFFLYSLLFLFFPLPFLFILFILFIFFQTTLLNVMSGRIKHTSGNVYINGVKSKYLLRFVLLPTPPFPTCLFSPSPSISHDIPADIEKYDKLVGFVPQDDTMLRVLTIRQILDHSARSSYSSSSLSLFAFLLTLDLATHLIAPFLSSRTLTLKHTECACRQLCHGHKSEKL